MPSCKSLPNVLGFHCETSGAYHLPFRALAPSQVEVATPPQWQHLHLVRVPRSLRLAMRGVPFRHLRRQPLQYHSCFQRHIGSFTHQCSRMSTTPPPHVLYKHIDDVETLTYYQPGGYHPIKIGDPVNERYCVVHKLGYGSFSTIWIARDKMLSKYVAVKVGTADSSETEVETLTRLSDRNLEDENPGKEFILPILDRFSIHGPNGTHPCFVTAPARCSLTHAKRTSQPWFFQLPVARSLAAQLAMAVAYIHKQGLVHGGEVWLRLFTVSRLDIFH